MLEAIKRWTLTLLMYGFNNLHIIAVCLFMIGMAVSQ